MKTAALPAPEPDARSFDKVQRRPDSGRRHPRTPSVLTRRLRPAHGNYVAPLRAQTIRQPNQRRL